jgi:urease accessory protein
VIDRCRTLAAPAGLALCLAALCTSAQAHTSARGMNDFYAGFLHPLTALEHVLPFLALGLFAGQQGRKAQESLPLFWVALMLGCAAALWLPGVPGVDLVNLLSTLVLGALIAAAVPLPLSANLGLALLFGLTHGYANGAAITPLMRPYLYIPGVGLAGLVVTGYGVIATDHILRRKVKWMSIAVRVAGSWIAAIGLLVLATMGKRLLT